MKNVVLLRTWMWLTLMAMSLLAGCRSAESAGGDSGGEAAALRARVSELETQLSEAQTAHLFTATELAAEERLRPDVNVMYRSENIGPLVAILETESREIFDQRFALAELVGPPPGAVVADIGAGTGFMVNIFSRQVGEEGTVYAVDINPTMMEHVAEGAAEEGLTNIETVVCTDTTVELPDESIDIAFICDVYHHFEFPMNSMTSLWHALKPGGQVVIVDFHRIEGQSRPFIMQHVRAGEEVFTQEILDAGFELVNDHDVEFLTENYVLRFRKVGG